MDTDNKSSTCIKILYIDRDEVVLKTVKMLIEYTNSDFEVDCVSSILHANQAVAKKKYGVILSEYYVENGQGLEFLKLQKEKGNKIPFIIFSVNKEIEDKALSLGAFSFVDKIGDIEKVYGQLSDDISEAVGRQ